MSLLSNHYRGIGLTNLETISSQQVFSTYYGLRKKLKIFIYSYPKLVALALLALLSLNLTLALLFLLSHLSI